MGSRVRSGIKQLLLMSMLLFLSKALCCVENEDLLIPDLEFGFLHPCCIVVYAGYNVEAALAIKKQQHVEEETYQILRGQSWVKYWTLSQVKYWASWDETTA